MSVYRVIDKLEASVKQGTVLPLGYRVVSEERLLELIEKLRASLPEEVGRARTIAKNGDRLVREAQEKAQAIVVEASSQSTALIDDHEIVRRARATAEIVLREAEQKAARVREGADGYAAQVLTELDARLSGALGSVKKGIDALTAAKTATIVSAPSLADAAAKSKRAAFDAQHDTETAELESV
ncbi:MAG: vacuolar-type H+-ATPase subunit [Candidatus Eremiobacteraeota bacterium]|jgi:cell division septum initiation protein DivIVA|nr:vacuolar-type H+-ATPase subunit [Candidatus Eremiobacteraeota bacterium]